ncbi:MAG: sugar ABC transporter substrate-binding protein [bacterium]
MKKSALILFCLFVFLAAAAAVNIGALEISVNKTHSDTLSPLELQTIARIRPVGGELLNTVVVEELLPVCRSLERLTVTSGSGKTVRLTEDGSVLPLYHSYLQLDSGGRLRFLHTDTAGRVMGRLDSVASIEIEAELHDSDSLEVWVSWEGVEELKSEIRRWSELHGIDVQVNEVPKSDSKMLSVLRGGGRPPDVLLIQSDYIPPLTAAGALQPMVRFPTDGFARKSLDALSQEGKLWAVPFCFDAQMLFYRRDLMSIDSQESGRAGWDLQEFEEISSGLLARGIAPAAWNAYSAYWLLPFQLGFGKQSILEADGSVQANDPATIAAVTYLKHLIDKGILDLRERDSMFSRFISGDVAMMLSASFSIPELERLGVDFGVAPFPDGPQGPIRPLLDFKGFAIARKTRRPLLARRFLLSMSDPAVQHAFTSAVFKLPVSELAWKLAKRENPYFQVMRYSYETGVPVPSSQGYKVYKNTMWKMLRFLLTGKMPVETGLERAQSLIDSQMTR